MISIQRQVPSLYCDSAILSNLMMLKDYLKGSVFIMNPRNTRVQTDSASYQNRVITRKNPLVHKGSSNQSNQILIFNKYISMPDSPQLTAIL